MTEKKSRNVNIELLRIISMMMVITLHGLDKGGQLTNIFEGNSATIASWILESLSIMAVNIYMLISGYFLVKSNFKCGRLFELICQVMFYSVGVIIFMAAIGQANLSSLTRYDWSIVLFPFHMNEYWFITGYILMYLFSPIIAKAVSSMKQGQLIAIISMLLIYESVVKSISPISFEADDKGYSATWFMTIFLIAAYIRLYGFKFLDKAWKGFVVYCISVILIFTENIYLQYRFHIAESFSLIQGVSYHYNHIFVVTAAVGIFAFFINAKSISGILAKIIVAISPMSFGVYLLHEQKNVRFVWPEWFQLNGANYEWYQLIIRVVLAVVVVYIVGTIVDYIRKIIFKLIGSIINRGPVNKALVGLDDLVNGR